MTEPSFGKSYAGSAPENYERYFVPAIGAPLAAALVDVAAPRPGERVLDVACGTGVVTRLVAERVGSTGTVTGLDGHPGMLAVARSVQGPGVPIEWREGSAEHLPFSDDAFDLVTRQMGLQFFPCKEPLSWPFSYGREIGVATQAKKGEHRCAQHRNSPWPAWRNFLRGAPT